MNSRQLQAAWFKSANADMKRDALKQLVGKGEIKLVDSNLVTAYQDLAADEFIAKINKAFGFRSGGISDTSFAENPPYGDSVPCKVDGKGIHIEFFDMFFGGGVGKWLGDEVVADGFTVEIWNGMAGYDAYYSPELKTHALVLKDGGGDAYAMQGISKVTGKPISKLDPAKIRDFRKGSKIIYVNLELASSNLRWTIPWDANVDWNEVYAAFGPNAPDWKQYEMTALFHVAGRDGWEVKMDYLNKEEVDELIETIKAGQVYYEVKEQK